MGRNSKEGRRVLIHVMRKPSSVTGYVFSWKRKPIIVSGTNEESAVMNFYLKLLWVIYK
jgi:hypothetical protein